MKHKQQQVPPPASANENPSTIMSVEAKSLRVLPPFPFISCEFPSKHLPPGRTVSVRLAGGSGAPGITGARRVLGPRPWAGDIPAREHRPGQSQALDTHNSR